MTYTTQNRISFTIKIQIIQCNLLVLTQPVILKIKIWTCFACFVTNWFGFAFKHLIKQYRFYRFSYFWKHVSVDYLLYVKNNWIKWFLVNKSVGPFYVWPRPRPRTLSSSLPLSYLDLPVCRMSDGIDIIFFKEFVLYIVWNTVVLQ